MPNDISASQVETAFFEYIQRAIQVNIPFFQRNYAWGKDEFVRMADDIGRVSDGTDDFRFIGAIVSVSRVEGLNNIDEVIDGQQRLTTLYMFLLSAIRVAFESDDTLLKQYALSLAQATLKLGMPVNGNSAKFLLSHKDWPDFKKVIQNLNEIDDVHLLIQSIVLPGSSPSAQNGKLWKMYCLWLEWHRTQLGVGHQEFRNSLDAGLKKIKWIHIQLADSGYASSVFEGLNNTGIKISTLDLLRNEVFSEALSNPTLAKTTYDNYWDPMAQKFLDPVNSKDCAHDYVFPFAVNFKSSVSRKECFRVIRDEAWLNANSSKEKIEVFSQFADAFRLVHFGVLPDTALYPHSINLERVIDFYPFGIPTVSYSFLLPLLTDGFNGVLDQDCFDKIWGTFESFLIRRMICGFEPTGLLAIFRKAYAEYVKTKDCDFLLKLIRNSSTVAFPSNQELKTAVINGPFYRRKAAPRNWLLRSYETSLGASVPINDFHVEHVCPQDRGVGWKNWSDEAHSSLVHSWGNLIPLSGPLNQSVANGEFASKKGEFAKKSMWPSARLIISAKSEWGEKEVRARGETIYKWLKSVWSVC